MLGGCRHLLRAHNLEGRRLRHRRAGIAPSISRYNSDNAATVEKFAIGVNTLGVVAQTKDIQGACTQFDVMNTIDRFDWYMQNVPGTQSVISLAGMAKVVNAGYNEGNIKWRQLPRDPAGDGAGRHAHRHPRRACSIPTVTRCRSS